MLTTSDWDRAAQSTAKAVSGTQRQAGQPKPDSLSTSLTSHFMLEDGGCGIVKLNDARRQDAFPGSRRSTQSYSLA